MAIRFKCGACFQPIEIDDEWAQKTVACPFCRKTVTAPAQSTLDDLSQIPTASAVERPDAAPPPYSMVANDALLAHPNRIAVVAAALAGVVLLCLIGIFGIMLGHAEEMTRLAEIMEQAGSFGEQMQVSNTFAQENGGVIPNWMIGVTLLEMVALLAWFAALVCGIVAVRRPRRRPLAVATLCFCGFAVVFVCGGALMGI